MEAAPNGVQGNKGVFTVMDSLDQPRLKGQGRMRRTRFSIRRHLQKHGLASANSDSDLEDEEAAEREWHTHTHAVLQLPLRVEAASVITGSGKSHTCTLTQTHSAFKIRACSSG